MENSLHSVTSAPDAINQSPDAQDDVQSGTSHSPVDTNPSFTPATEDLNQIRNILFGEQTEQQNKRLDQLERRFITSYDQLRSETHQRIDALESRLTQRIDELSRRLEQATTGLHTTISAVDQTLKQEITHQTFTIRTELSEQINSVEGQLRSQLNTQQSTDSEQRIHLSTLFGEISKKLSETQS